MISKTKTNTLELDEIKPTIPGMGLICTPWSLSITCQKTVKQERKLFHYDAEGKKRGEKKAAV